MNKNISSRERGWQAVFDRYNLHDHDFCNHPYFIKGEQIKAATKHFETTGEREVRILCKQDTRESRPEVFKKLGLFILPVKNGEYVILKGEGYVDIPIIETPIQNYRTLLDFQLETSLIGDSEMQHLDFAYASSLIRHFIKDNSLVLTIRGRKYTPEFTLKINDHVLKIKGVQTEVDAGYEGKNQIVLIEAKNLSIDNVIIRQLYYPSRQWQLHTKKKIVTLFFAKKSNIYYLWKFEFENPDNYNSIKLVDSARFAIIS
ncbi:MAG: type II restriction enzyme [Microcystis sp.]|uniref:type II restriction enzyme n=1 Tax=Microcystis sp. TaxID=1127 RepID=UPI00391DBDB0